MRCFLKKRVLCVTSLRRSSSDLLESNVMKEKEVVDLPRLFLASPSDSGYFGEK